MSFYGKWETWKIVYTPKELNGGMRGVAFVEAGPSTRYVHLSATVCGTVFHRSVLREAERR